MGCKCNKFFPLFLHAKTNIIEQCKVDLIIGEQANAEQGSQQTELGSKVNFLLNAKKIIIEQCKKLII